MLICKFLNRTGALAIVLSTLMILSCNSNKISLERVSFLPEYFTAEKHFGRDITSVEQANNYLLVTGKIDTTSEVAPLKMGVIVVDKAKIYLNLINSTKTNDTITEVYTGNGYSLALKYTINSQGLPTESYLGQINIKNGNLNSEYKVVGEQGYH